MKDIVSKINEAYDDNNKKIINKCVEQISTIIDNSQGDDVEMIIDDLLGGLCRKCRNDEVEDIIKHWAEG